MAELLDDDRALDESAVSSVARVLETACMTPKAAGQSSAPLDKRSST